MRGRYSPEIQSAGSIAFPVLLLILADQGSKYWVKHHFIGGYRDWGNGLIRIWGMLNPKYRAFSSVPEFLFAVLPELLINLAVLGAGWLMYGFIRDRFGMGKGMRAGFALFFAGMLSTVIDRFIPGGNPVFIEIASRFQIDLKDLYLAAVRVMLVWFIFAGFDTWRNLDVQQTVEDAGAYIKGKFSRRR